MRITKATSDEIRKHAEIDGNKVLANKCVVAGYWPPEDSEGCNKVVLEVAKGGMKYTDIMDERSVTEIDAILDALVTDDKVVNGIMKDIHADN